MEGEGNRSFGQFVRQQRSIRGLRQGDLAARVGVDQTKISEWENDRSRPRSRYLPALARELESPMSELHRLLGDEIVGDATGASVLADPVMAFLHAHRQSLSTSRSRRVLMAVMHALVETVERENH